jgi:ATP-binding cassette, subfamily D (ALD), peroxisomal long-chain fatty acid import protein
MMLSQGELEVGVLAIYFNHAFSDPTLLDYIGNRRLLVSLADAGGRLMYAYKDVLELAGLTGRLYTLLSTLHNLPPLALKPFDLEGEEKQDDIILLSHVDVGIPGEAVAPLVRDLSLTIRPGEHLMITGSNGVGKTAVARVLAGLWPPLGTDASLVIPCPSKGVGVFVVPQRAYMVTGSLLEQVIYPHSYQEFLDSGKTMEDIKKILEMVYLAYLPEREGGWTTRKEWRDVLSGGEKQRMGLARAFYHRPQFAILDGG